MCTAKRLGPSFIRSANSLAFVDIPIYSRVIGMMLMLDGLIDEGSNIGSSKV
jgi:hypothetical protein